jgi:hypothetical protein
VRQSPSPKAGPKRLATRNRTSRWAYDDDRLGCAEVLPPMVEVGRNNEKTGGLLADTELVDAAFGGRVAPSIENYNLYEAAYDEKTVGASLVEPPSADSAW